MPDIAPLDQTISDLQAQIDRLSLTLHQWREAQDHMQPMEERLSHITERFSEILNRWNETDRRHAQAIGDVEERVGEWGAIENRLQQESRERLKELEQTIEHEWKALREVHEEPARQLREQAAALGETCMAAANLAIKSFERADIRFTAFEHELQQRLTQLSTDVRATLEEARALRAAAPALAAPVQPFELEGVMRIHDELRGDDDRALPSAGATAHAPVAKAPDVVVPPSPRLLPEAAALSDRVTSLEREVEHEKEEVRESVSKNAKMRRVWGYALVGLGVVLLGSAYVGVTMQRQMNARLDAAATRVAAAEQQAQAANDAATRQMAATRADAEKQIGEARVAALNAQIVSNVLAAPDLVRFNLVGPDPTSRASAQVLWSRTRGLVLSASRLPAAAGSVYQVWVLTAADSISAGTFIPDREGRGTFAVETPAAIGPRGISGVIVTAEPPGGASAPGDAVVLARPVAQTPAPDIR